MPGSPTPLEFSVRSHSPGPLRWESPFLFPSALAYSVPVQAVLQETDIYLLKILYLGGKERILDPIMEISQKPTQQASWELGALRWESARALLQPRHLFWAPSAHFAVFLPADPGP